MSTEDPLEMTLEERLEEARQHKADADRVAEHWGSEVQAYEMMLATYRARGDTRPTPNAGTPAIAPEPKRRVRYLCPVKAMNESPQRVRYPRRGASGEAVLRLLRERPKGTNVGELAQWLRERGHLARSNNLKKSTDWEVYNLIRNGWPIDRRLGHYRLDLERCSQLGLHIP